MSYIYLDLEKEYNDPIKIKQGDVGVTKEIILSKEGAMYDLTNKTVQFFSRKPDGNVVYVDCEIVKNDDAMDVIQINFTNQMLMVAGDMLFELLIIDSNQEVSTIPVNIEIIKSVRYLTNITEESKSVINVISGQVVDGSITLNKLCTDLQNEISKIDGVSTEVLQLTQQLNNIVASAGNDNTEIVASRTDSFGNDYSILGQRLSRYDKGILTYNDITTLKADKKLHEGQIVYIKGYYAGDTLSNHMRVISVTDNGFGELLDNGLYANLMYQNNEINVTHIGARNSYNSEYVIYDIISYVEKIRNKGLTVFIPSGWWAMSFKNFAKNSFKIKGACIQPLFNDENASDNVCSTVLFPYTEGQEALISLGVDTKEIRGCEISNLQIVTNCKQYDSNNNFVSKTLGAKIGMDLKTFCFSDVSNLIITGSNTDAEYGIKYNGCESDFNDIMFRRFGSIGSNAKCAFYTYNRVANGTTGAVACAVSGGVFNRIDYEGVGCTHFNATGVDTHFTNSCNEFGYIRCADGHTYTAVNYTDIPAGATVNYKGLVNIADGTNGIIFDTITIQKLGQTFKHTYTDEDGNTVDEYDVWDSFFTQSSDYLNNVYFSYNMIKFQDVKKDINTVYFPDNLSYSDNVNKGVIGAGLVLCDNYQAKVIVRDNMGVQLSEHKHTIPRVNNGFSYNNIQTTFMNRVVTCNDSALQHGVRWNNTRQYEYFSRIIGSNTYTSQYANYIALFNVDEYLLAGTNTIYFYYVNQLNTAITMDVVFTFKDGTTRTETVSFNGTNNSSTKLLKYTFNVDVDKRVTKIEFNNCTNNSLRICRVEHRIS